MKGFGTVALCGNVSGPIRYDETGRGDRCCSFVVVIEDRDYPKVFVRVNVYGGLVTVCENKLEKGVYASVQGTLMNRIRTDADDENKGMVEVRAERLVFM